MAASPHEVRKDFVRERVMIWLPSHTACADREEDALTEAAVNGTAAEAADDEVAGVRAASPPSRALFAASLSERLGPSAAPPTTCPTAGAPASAATSADAPACDNAHQTTPARARLFRAEQT